MSSVFRISSFWSRIEQKTVLPHDLNLSEYSRSIKHSVMHIGSIQLLLVATVIGSSSVFAQVGGTSIGVNPISEFVCENLTTQQIVKAVNPMSVQWDCADLGLALTPGDEIVQSVKGYVADPSYVGGSTRGLTAINKLKCENKTIGQTQTIKPPTSDWNCSSTGLVLRVGDVIKQSIRATAAAEVPVLPDVPTNLVAIAGNSSVTLSWNAAVGAEYYRVYNIPDSVNAASTRVLLAESLTTMFTHSGLTNGMTYTYAVTSINAVGESIASNIVLVVPVVIPFDHMTVLGQACAICHVKPAAHLPSTNTCDDCHSVMAWIPATFNHIAITGSCSTCHNNVFAPGKPAAHFVTSVDCGACHNITIWRQVRYTHNLGNYPGDHNLVLTCTNCHVSNAETVDWRYPAYAPSCAGCHTSSYRPASHNGSSLSAMRNCSDAGCHRVKDRAW